jgi:transcriptional regulator of acetoin/glycerol metabolism
MRWTLLAQQAWPGNIRELRNVLEQATLMTDDCWASREPPCTKSWR